MTEISYLEYENIPKGKIASINYKEEKKEIKEKTRRRKGPRLTQKKKTNKVSSPAKKAESGMIVGNKYFIEDKTRRKNEYKVVYTGTYVGMRTIGNDVYLKFKETKILVNPFKSAGTASGFSPIAYKFIERIE
jgi:uncharacterized membrane protein YebE (DUF533 family)